MISRPPVDVVIPEQLAASYGLYIWPCAPVLAWYIWLHQVRFKDCHKKSESFHISCCITQSIAKSSS